MSKIGSNIRKIRSVKGLSQVAYAEIFKISRANIGAYEEGRAEPKIDVAIEMANFFSIPLNDLFTKDLTVNQLTNFKLSLQANDNTESSNSLSSSLHFISTELLFDHTELIAKIKDNKTLPKVDYPISGFKKHYWIETKKEILGAKKIYSLIGSLIKKPKLKDVILVISENEIALGYYKEGSSKLVLEAYDSKEEINLTKIKCLFKIDLITSTPKSNVLSIDERLMELEKRMESLETGN